MQKPHKLAIVLLLTGALALPVAMPFANAQLSVPGVVDITSSPTVTCGVNEVPLGSGMNYGSLGSNQDSTTQQFTLTNTGTTAANTVVTGTDWIGAINNGLNTMPSSATHYSLTQGLAYDGMSALSGASQPFAQIDPGAQLVSYWVLRTGTFTDTDLDGDGIVEPFAGQLTQTVTFTSSC